MILDPPNTRLWAERLTWFDRRLRPDGLSRPVQVGAQTEALLHECRRAFASGGWVTVVVLAQAVIDSELAERVDPVRQHCRQAIISLVLLRWISG